VRIWSCIDLLDVPETPTGDKSREESTGTGFARHYLLEDRLCVKPGCLVTERPRLYTAELQRDCRSKAIYHDVFVPRSGAKPKADPLHVQLCHFIYKNERYLIPLWGATPSCPQTSRTPYPIVTNGAGVIECSTLPRPIEECRRGHLPLASKQDSGRRLGRISARRTFHSGAPNLRLSRRLLAYR